MKLSHRIFFFATITLILLFHYGETPTPPSARVNSPLPSTPPPPHSLLKNNEVNGSDNPSAAAIEFSITKWEKKLDQIKSCEEHKDCSFAQPDSRAYSFAVAHALADELLEFKSDVSGHNIVDPQVAKTAIDSLVSSSDGFVKEAALSLLATQPPSDEGLEAMLDGVIEFYDAQLIDPALKQIKRYDSRADLKKIDETFESVLLTGSPFVAQKLSNEISPFITDRNADAYELVAKNLPAQSAVRSNLVAAIAQFRKSR